MCSNINIMQETYIIINYDMNLIQISINFHDKKYILHVHASSVWLSMAFISLLVGYL